MTNFSSFKSGFCVYCFLNLKSGFFSSFSSLDSKSLLFSKSHLSSSSSSSLSSSSLSSSSLSSSSLSS
ncbi:MAG: hypothetical protein EBY39_14480 [Flavobacteriia bacterium]|nr:hypothetical protein [Flavobacteriia bacterium]